MKISRTYTLIYSILICSSLALVVFILQYQLTDPYFPFWITAISLSFLITSIGSFIWNFKTVQIKQNGILVKRLFRANKQFKFSEIENIEEGIFKYRGSSPTSSLYEGYFLTIKTKNQKIRTTSFNEPEYSLLRKNLKNHLEKKVMLDENYRGDNLNQFLLIIMCIAGLYLAFRIISNLDKFYP